MSLDPRRYLKLPDDPRDVAPTPRTSSAWERMVDNLVSSGESRDEARRHADSAGNSVERGKGRNGAGK